MYTYLVVSSFSTAIIKSVIVNRLEAYLAKSCELLLSYLMQISMILLCFGNSCFSELLFMYFTRIRYAQV